MILIGNLPIYHPPVVPPPGGRGGNSFPPHPLTKTADHVHPSVRPSAPTRSAQPILVLLVESSASKGERSEAEVLSEWHESAMPKQSDLSEGGERGVKGEADR
jgi:hypothetical protein